MAEEKDEVMKEVGEEFVEIFEEEVERGQY